MSIDKKEEKKIAHKYLKEHKHPKYRNCRNTFVDDMHISKRTKKCPVCKKIKYMIEYIPNSPISECYEVCGICGYRFRKA